MADITLAIQKAIIGKLAGITAPGAQGGMATVPIYDHQPENAAFPFVVISGQGVAPDDAYDALYSQHTIYLSIWSLYRGQRQALAIMSAIFDRLHNADLTLEAGESLLCRVTSQLTNREPDDITYQGAMTITVIAAH